MRGRGQYVGDLRLPGLQDVAFVRSPLAHARNRILDHRWHQHLDRLIADDGHLTNPPGAERRHRSP